ncbi:hypothetical protein [Corynebacterium mayonis]|uniref:hypothetical protein n=1 Tax=Corynebacterium mayonis TaxID=3062461 RepID=UPI00314023BD
MVQEIVSSPGRHTAFGSFRKRIVTWFLALVALTLVVLILTTRTVLLTGVIEHANEDVVQETEEFATFAAEGRDPETSAPFESPQRLLEVYLARQIPGPDEALVGVVGGQLIQMANSPRPLQAGEPLVTTALESRSPSGVFEHPDLGPVHWATVTVEGTDTALLAARFTDTGRDGVAANLRVISIISVGALLLAAGLAWFVAGSLLDPVRQVRTAAAGLNSRHRGQRVPVPEHGDADTADLARTFNTLLERIDVADDAYQGILARLESQTRAWLDRVRQSAAETGDAALHAEAEEGARILATVTTLSSLTVGSRPSDTAVTVPAESVGRDVEKQLRANGLPVALVSNTNDTTPVTLNLDSVILAMSEAARFCAQLSTPVELGAELNDGVLSLWVRESGVGCESARLDQLLDWHPNTAYPEGNQAGLALLRAVADAHGGKAWAQSTRGLGTITGLDLPVSVDGEVQS